MKRCNRFIERWKHGKDRVGFKQYFYCMKAITTRIPEGIFKDIEEISKSEKTDMAEVIRRFRKKAAVLPVLMIRILPEGLLRFDPINNYLFFLIVISLFPLYSPMSD